MSGWVARKILRKEGRFVAEQASFRGGEKISPELYATSSISKRDGVELENTEGDSQDNTAFRVEYSRVESNT